MCQFMYQLLRNSAESELGKLLTAEIITEEELLEMTGNVFPWESALCVADKVKTHHVCGGGRMRSRA